MKNLLIILGLFIINHLHADCSDLNYYDCLQWPDYCEWNEESGQCQNIGGDGGDDIEYGPYQYETLTETDGLRNGPEYLGAILYYPFEGIPPYKSIVITPGWGEDESSIQDWGTYYVSHGFIAMTIGPNDPINDTWEDRGIGLLDAIETIRQENERNNSPLFGMIDINNFAVSGYSIGGGAAQVAATLDESIDAVIALNPMLLFLDTENCDAESDYYCLLPEHLDHSVPVLIITGENELDELPDYENYWGLVHYEYTPITTDKIYFEMENDGHGSAAYPNGDVDNLALMWLKYYLLNEVSICDSLVVSPETASQYLTNLECVSAEVIDIQIPFIQDWNLVGLPVMVDNSDIEMIFPELIEGTLFSFNGGYNLETNLFNGEGYWLRFNEAGSTTISGTPIYQLAISLNEGWNLITGISTSLDILDIQDPDEIMISGTTYGFDNGVYTITEILEPGKGYWVRTNNSGSITMIDN